MEDKDAIEVVTITGLSTEELDDAVARAGPGKIVVLEPTDSPLAKLVTKLRVILVSPFAGGDTQSIRRNRRYLRKAIWDSIINHSEAPFASHEMYTRALDDNEQHERELGMKLMRAWLGVAQRVVVYADHGITGGMQMDIAAAVELKIPMVVRFIEGKETRGKP